MKKMTKYTKTQRVLAVVDVLERWGKLDKKQLNQHLSTALSAKIDEAFERSLYRDMEDLVRDGIVKEHRYTRDGIEIEDYDPDLHKNTICYWSVFGSENRMRGESLINGYGGKIFVSKSLKNEMSLLPGNHLPKGKFRYLYFGIGSIFLCLEISFEALPFTIFLSRTNGEISPEEENVISALTKRFVILKLPVPNMSSFKDVTRAGHTSINFKDNETVVVTDLNSSNGTSIHKLKIDEAERVRDTTEGFLGLTIKNGSSHIDFPLRDFPPVQSAQSISVPLLVQCSESFRILVL